MSQSEEFTPYTPLYHKKLDTWGLARGTRVWVADGSFAPAENVQIGDNVLGIAYGAAQVADPNQRGPQAIQTIWRPKLISREVLGRRVVKARAWQLTFGDHEKQHYTRRLVAGGATSVRLEPHVPSIRETKPLVRLQTTLDNPRVERQFREARQIDQEWSQEAGEIRRRTTALTGTPKGDKVMTIPYEHYGGTQGLFNTKSRPFRRFGYTQAREVTVLVDEIELVQLIVKPDVKKSRGVFEYQRPRANIIAQTPFDPEDEERVVVTDPRAQAIGDMSSAEDMDEWDSYVNSITPEGDGPEENEGQQVTMKTKKQGLFHTVRNDTDFAQNLEDNYGISLSEGFLDGGILIHLPLTPELRDQKTGV